MTMVYAKHLGQMQPRYCVAGTRAFFLRHGMDWRGFLRNGLPAEAFEATGDAMAIKLAAHARAHDGR